MADMGFGKSGALSRRHPVLSRFGPAALTLILAAHQAGARVSPRSTEIQSAVPLIRRQAPKPIRKPPFEAVLPEKPEIRREEKPLPRRRR